MKYRMAVAAALFPVAAWAWPWSTDMVNQPSIKPQEGEMRAFPQRSVPVGGIATEVANRDEAKPLTSPIQPTAANLAQGRTLFRIYCAACHGLTGKADSPVASKIGAIPLVDDYVQKTLTEGWIWGTITFGSYIMPAYGKPQAREDGRGSNDLSVEERWQVVSYVRHQLVQDAAAEPTRTAAAQ
ncbi:MAG: cytochrome c [Gammaproteobacteria bacterium]|nr:cytochrome c [Gammaproteobacteria bacterium]